VCQDFCDGTQHYEPDQKYYVCVDQRIESAISDCNKAAGGRVFRQYVEQIPRKSEVIVERIPREKSSGFDD
jgi:hypothetical protein